MYTHISNIFELALLQSLGAKIAYPPPMPAKETTTAGADIIPPPPPSPPPTPREGGKSRKSRFSAVWSFLTKKTFGVRQSLEQYDRQMADALVNGLRHVKHEALPPPTMTKAETEDAISRLAIGVSSGPSDPFTTALKAIQAESSIFSTSHSVRFEPPDTLIRLASDEAEGPSMTSSQNTSSAAGGSRSSGDNRTITTTTTTTTRKRRRVTGADKAALSSILGWRLDSSGSGFGGTSTFLKHQCITVLYSSSVRMGNPIEAKPPAGTLTPRPGNATPSTAGPAGGRNAPGSSLPSSSHWMTYRYYDEKEPTLGQWIVETSEEAEIMTQQQNLVEDITPLEHIWVHLNRKLTARIEVHSAVHNESDEAEGAAEHDPDEIAVWNSCGVCGKTTPTRVLEPGAWCAHLKT